jgi:hypothetical protein
MEIGESFGRVRDTSRSVTKSSPPSLASLFGRDPDTLRLSVLEGDVGLEVDITCSKILTGFFLAEGRRWSRVSPLFGCIDFVQKLKASA